MEQILRISFGTDSTGEEGWPSGNMSDCNARGREFKSWLGQNKFLKSDGQ